MRKHRKHQRKYKVKQLAVKQRAGDDAPRPRWWSTHGTGCGGRSPDARAGGKWGAGRRRSHGGWRRERWSVGRSIVPPVLPACDSAAAARGLRLLIFSKTVLALRLFSLVDRAQSWIVGGSGLPRTCICFGKDSVARLWAFFIYWAVPRACKKTYRIIACKYLHAPGLGPGCPGPSSAPDPVDSICVGLDGVVAECTSARRRTRLT